MLLQRFCGADANEPGGFPPGSIQAFTLKGTARPRRTRSLQFDVCADLFQLGLGCLSIGLGGLLQERLRGTVYKVLGVLETNAEQILDDLDDLDATRDTLTFSTFLTLTKFSMSK